VWCGNQVPLGAQAPRGVVAQGFKELSSEYGTYKKARAFERVWHI